MICIYLYIQASSSNRLLMCAFDSANSQVLFLAKTSFSLGSLSHIPELGCFSTCRCPFRYKHCGQWRSICSWRSCMCWAPTVWTMALGRAWTSSCRLPAPLLTPSCTMSSCRFATAQHTHGPMSAALSDEVTVSKCQFVACIRQHLL